MKITLVFGLSLLASATWAYDRSDLVGFYTDGCTDVPDGSPAHPAEWLHCCYKHDQKYFAGGTREDKQNADLELGHCLQNSSGSKTLASLYYFGVRIAGTPYLNTAYRWGYGWPYGRGYAPLSLEERSWVVEKLAGFACLRELNAFTYDSVELHKACD